MKRIHLLLLLMTVLSLAACNNPFEPEDRVGYYDVVIEGCVFDRDTKQPVEGAKVTARSSARGDGLFWGWYDEIEEKCFTDNSGYYKIPRAVRYFDGHKAGYVEISVWLNNDYYSPNLNLTDVMKKQTGIIQLDTFWIYKQYH
jgi:hypothetical protein